MPKYYTLNVLDDYEKKKKANTLFSELLHPTPAGLREETLRIYLEKGSPKEATALRSFFGPLNNAQDYTQRIQTFDLDKFRPLVNFLHKRTVTTNKKNIELLAWLIDFQLPSTVANSEIGRTEQPVSYLIKPRETESIEIDDSAQLDNIDDLSGGLQVRHQIQLDDHSRKQKKRELLFDSSNQKGIVAFSIAAIIAVSLYIWFTQTRQQCMYWTGSHYEVIACNLNKTNVSVVALDTFKVAHLKKITLPDTITAYSIKKVYYSKINGKIEFYTYSGVHPLDNGKILRPMTEYILNKYVLKTPL